MRSTFTLSKSASFRVSVAVPKSVVRRTENEPADRLLKPVRRKSTRGALVSFILEGDGGARSMDSCFAQFGTTRPRVISALWFVRVVHGIGYTVDGDTITLQLPEGVAPDEIWSR
ncbi:hypothetical protein ACJMQP_03910 [Rhodopseudomonas palustris]